jgi:hypothetical protein
LGGGSNVKIKEEGKKKMMMMIIISPATAAICNSKNLKSARGNHKSNM